MMPTAYEAREALCAAATEFQRHTMRRPLDLEHARLLLVKAATLERHAAELIAALYREPQS